MPSIRIIASRPFTFEVGEEGTICVVHEAVIATLSPALAALMQGEMSESLSGKARWVSVDEDTFARFAQYAYTSNYSVQTDSTPTMPLDSSGSGCVTLSTTVDSSQCQVGGSEFSPSLSLFGTTPSKDKGKKTQIPTPPTPPTPFAALSYPLRDAQHTYVKFLDFSSSEVDKEELDDSLIAHASLYVLGEKWGLENLRMLVLAKIQRNLMSLSFNEGMIPSIVNFARYAYSDGNTPDLEPAIDKLRELVCLYIVDHIKSISIHANFIELMGEGGPLAKDVWRRVIL